VLAFLLTFVLVLVNVVDMDVTRKNIGCLFGLHLTYGLIIGMVFGVWRLAVAPIVGA